MTMLQLVQILQADADTVEEVVDRATVLIRSGRVVLCGNFAHCVL
jgi:hypothetical protein